jgi:hypothetical protein
VSAGFQPTPTGRYERRCDNIGKGMILSRSGTTVISTRKDRQCRRHGLLGAHGNKKDTDVRSATSLARATGVVPEAAIVARPTMPSGSHRRSADRAELPSPADHRESGTHKVRIRPDVTLPVASKSKLFALVNIRYL